MASYELKNAISSYEEYIAKNGIDMNVIDAYVNAVEVALRTENDIEYGLRISERAKIIIGKFIIGTTGGNIWELERYEQEHDVEYDIINKFYEVLKQESLYKFESFIYFMEKKRKYEKRFYLPRRKTLRIVLNDLQELEDGKFRFYGLSMPSRVGKSTMNIFFLAWIALKRPNSHSAMGGHSGILAKGFYKELLNLIATDEYTFRDLYTYFYPKYADKGIPTDKSADEFTITLGRPDRFATITCRGIDGTWTGAVDVSADGYLYVDDLVRDREHSLSPARMENTFQEYLNKMVDRKNDGARELMVGTLWNVLDPLERMRKQYENNPEYRFRRIPALNEQDESNFDYEINGFSTEYYREMRDKLDKPEWEAKFMQRPFVREGLLFPENELRYFDGNIPESVKEKEYRTWALCDPAFGGADSLSMPICIDYGDKDRYIIDWIFKKGTQAVTVPLIVNAIKKHYVTELHIEQNAGGKLMTDSIKAEMKRQDVMFCHIVPYYANTRLPKDAKIKGYSDWVKENFTFLMPKKYIDTDKTDYKRSMMYQEAMDELEMYTSEGKNPHDDAADSVCQMAIVYNKERRKTVIMASPV